MNRALPLCLFAMMATSLPAAAQVPSVFGPHKSVPAPSVGEPGATDLVPSLALGTASGIALFAHGAYQDLAVRRRNRLKEDCADECPNHRINEYREAKKVAEMSLTIGVLAAASSLWLMYHEPRDLVALAQHPKKRHRKRGLTLRLKPQRRGVWASVVARF